jgi:hypothetical protein
LALVEKERLMDQPSASEDLQTYRSALAESTGEELLQVLLILVQLLEDENAEP